MDVPLAHLFDYLPPAGTSLPVIGARVLVPFGRRQQCGVVMDVVAHSELPKSKLKRASRLLDRSAILGDADLKLIRFTADYYHHPIGEVAATALPALLRQGKALYPVVECVAATDVAKSIDVEALAKRARRQGELLQLLLDAGAGGMDVDTLREIMPTWRQAAKGLFAKDLIQRFETRGDDASPSPQKPVLRPGPELNAEQARAVWSVRATEGFQAFVLDGITGSGKTEVYLKLIEQQLEAGRQVLILVPEIGLTPQLVSRLTDRLGIQPALLHSGLTNLERLAAWRHARSGDAKLVVGTRSAVFAPLPGAGLIIVDEEHDASFKQQEGLRYSARDLAIVRAKHLDVPILLGSATPTLEMLHHCRHGQYEHLKLPRRAGAAEPPSIRLVDLLKSHVSDGLSEPLAESVARHLADGGQALLFLNRRGFAPTLICTACGHVAECERCDSRMTVHAQQRELRCHHCGAARPLDTQCSECGEAVKPLGEGTERLEDAIARRFPDRRVQRIDSDSTQRKGAMHAALAAATAGDADILVGTQMLSKGHHFPKLSLVGVVNADQGLFGTDFRSDERLAQSIVQVAGRAGRESKPGEVIIQTAFAAHPFWQRLIDGGYSTVADQALEEREAAHWPPFSRLALLRAAAHKRDDAFRLLNIARDLAANLDPEHLRVLGPVDAPMARRAGRYRAQLLLQSIDRQPLHRALKMLRTTLEGEPAARRVRWSIDVDPIELF